MIKSLLRIAITLLVITIVFAYLFRFEKYEFSKFIADQTGIVLFKPEYSQSHIAQEEIMLAEGEKSLKELQQVIKDKAFFQCLIDTGISDVDKFRSISCPEKNIKSVAGLNVFRYVSDVDLSGNEISKISLSNLPLLRTLDASKNKVSHFKAGRTLFLSDVNLSDNRITEFKVERTINHLNLRNNKLTELPELRAKHVNLQGNFIESIGMDFSPFIETLDLRRNKIKKITNYKRRSSVIPVIPSYFERINRKKPVATHIKVKPFILLAHNPIDEIDFDLLNSVDIDIAALSPDELVFPDEALRACIEYQPVIKIEELVHLNCSGKTKLGNVKHQNKIASIEGLSSLVAVQTIDFSHNNLLKANLSGLNNLKEVNFESNQLETVIWPEEHQIKTLNLAHNKLEHLALDGFDYLKRLNLSANNLVFFDYPVSNLEVFNIDENPIRRQKNLQEDIEKQGLKIYGDFLTSVPDVILSNCIAAHLFANNKTPQQLTKLNCLDYEVENFKGLEKLTGLKSLAINMGSEVGFDLDLSELTMLNELTLKDSRLKQLYISNPELYKLRIFSSSIGTLDLTHNKKLVNIWVSSSEIEVLNLPESRQIEPNYFYHKIKVDDTALGQLNMQGGCKFNELIVSNGKLPAMKIPDNCSIEKLNLHRVGLAEFIIGQNVQIKSLNLPSNHLKELDLSQLRGGESTFAISQSIDINNYAIEYYRN